MWSGDADKIPAGWQLCNGEKETPDLSGRFIIGTGGKYGHKTTGGEETVALTSAQTPLREHSHIYWGNDGQKLHSFTHVPTGYTTVDTAFWSFHLSGYIAGYFIQEGAWRYETSKESDGSAVAHNNIPPYYALCFIMKL